MNDQDENDKLDPIAAVFGLDTPTPTFADIHPSNTGNLNEKASTLVDPTTGQLVPRKVDEVTLSDLEKEERIEDLQIDAQLDHVHNVAIEAFEHQQRMSQEVDPKFSARNSEVAAQYLKIALDAVSQRVDAKYKRQKVRIAKQDIGTPGTVNNNVIVADRNALLKELINKKSNPLKDIDE